VTKPFTIENAKQRERLGSLARSLTDGELALTLYPEGWTVAVALAHLGFWDARRLMLVRKWRREGVAPSPIDEDVVNDALLLFLLAIPPRKAADLALATAEALDRSLERLPEDMITAIDALGDPHALDRSIHRRTHLDEIDALVSAERAARKAS